jgi:hypothetical protein
MNSIDHPQGIVDSKLKIRLILHIKINNMRNTEILQVLFKQKIVRLIKLIPKQYIMVFLVLHL